MLIREFTGKTTQEAIDAGLAELGVTIADVRVDVLQEGAKGLFGLFGSKPARVRITVMEDSKDEDMSIRWSIDEEKPAREEKPAKKKQSADRPKQEDAEQKKPQPDNRKTREPAKPKQVKKEEPAEIAVKADAAEDAVQTQKEPKENKDAPAKQQRQPKERKPRAPKPKTEKPREAMAPAEVFQPTEPPVLYPEDTPAGCAQRFLMNLTEKMGVKVDVYVDQNQENALGLRLIGDTLGILIGRRGETLDAIQYLTSLQVNRGNEDYIRVVLDTENYRAKREDSLRRLAMRMANRAQKTGRRVVMEPMNPYERRVMHTALQDHPAVTTHSEGEEPNRRVVITLKATENTSVDAAGEEGTEAVQKPKRKRSHRRSRKPKTARTETVSSENTAIEQSATPASIEE